MFQPGPGETAANGEPTSRRWQVEAEATVQGGVHFQSSIFVCNCHRQNCKSRKFTEAHSLPNNNDLLLNYIHRKVYNILNALKQLLQITF